MVVAKAVTVAVERWYKKTHYAASLRETATKNEAKTCKNDAENMAKGKITKGDADNWSSTLLSSMIDQSF